MFVFFLFLNLILFIGLAIFLYSNFDHLFIPSFHICVCVDVDVCFLLDRSDNYNKRLLKYFKK